MSDNFNEEVQPFLRLLRTEAFRFVWVRFNHYDLSRRLKHTITSSYPDRPVKDVDARDLTFQSFLKAYEQSERGFFFINNFESVLKEPDLYAGLNLKRDRLAQREIALIGLFSPSSGPLVAREISEKMPDLWSLRSYSLTLTREYNIPKDLNFIDNPRNLNLQFNNSSLGGRTKMEKEEELDRLQGLIKEHTKEDRLSKSLLVQIKDLQIDLGQYKEALASLNNLIVSSQNIQNKSEWEREKRQIEFLFDSSDLVQVKDDRSSFASKKEIPKVLGSIPFLSKFFIGREKELQDIHGIFWGQKHQTLLLNGIGGIGKTSLASYYYDRYKSAYQHLIWIFAGENLIEALLDLAPNLKITFPDTLPTPQRLKLLFDALKDLRGTSLLIIDNADQKSELENISSFLHSLSNVHVLLTSRIEQFPTIQSYSLQPLSKEEALSLFQQFYPNHSSKEDTLFYSLAKSINYNPLVIELIAKTLHLRTWYRLQDFLDDLKKVGLSNLQPKKSEEIIASLYDLGELSELEQQILAIFSVLPAENLSRSTLMDLLPSFDILFTTLISLAQKGWIKQNPSEEFFMMHPLIQEIYRLKASSLYKACEEMIEQLIHKLDYEGAVGHLVNSSYEEALLLSRYAEAILNSIPEIELKLGILAERLGIYHQTTGNLEQALHFFESCQEISQALYESDPNNLDYKDVLATSFQNIGNIHSALGNLTEALHFFQNYQELEKQLYETYPQNASFKNGLAVSYAKLGQTHTELGNLQEAMRFFQVDIQLSQELYEAYPQNVSYKNGLAMSYSGLGEIHSQMGNLGDSLQFFQKQTELLEQLYENYPQNVSFKNGLAISYGKLGQNHSQMGNREESLQFFQKQVELLEQLYEDYTQNISFKNGLSISYSNLGQTHNNLGILEEALRFFQADVQLSKELYEAYPDNVSFKNGLAISYSKLGQTYSDLGNLEEALRFFREYQNLEQQLHEVYPQNVSFKNGLAISYAKLGQLAERQQDTDKAKEYFKQARTLWEALVESSPSYAEFQKNLRNVNAILTNLEETG